MQAVITWFLQTFGKKLIASVLGWGLSTLLAFLEAKWHLGLSLPEICGPGVGSSVYAISQGVADAGSKGATSSVAKAKEVERSVNSDQMTP